MARSFPVRSQSVSNRSTTHTHTHRLPPLCPQLIIFMFALAHTHTHSTPTGSASPLTPPPLGRLVHLECSLTPLVSSHQMHEVVNTHTHTHPVDHRQGYPGHTHTHSLAHSSVTASLVVVVVVVVSLLLQTSSSIHHFHHPSTPIATLLAPNQHQSSYLFAII